MPRPTVKWTWLGTIAFFFAWGFVIHGVGLLLHEVGGHALATLILGCGIDRINLTYFGHGFVQHAACTPWTSTRRLIFDWPGIAVTLSAGVVTMAFQRTGLTPLTRLLLALLAAWFLLGQLGYATAGGFYEVGDPALTAIILEAHGLHVLAWFPPLVVYAAAALYSARAIVDAFREHFGSRTRIDALKQTAATLGTAGLLYFVAFGIESAIRTDVVRGVDVAAERRAAIVQEFRSLEPAEEN